MWRTDVRYRSTLAIVTFFCTQPLYAYDISHFNFERQAAQYVEKQTYSSLTLSEKRLISKDKNADLTTKTTLVTPQYLQTSTDKNWRYLKEQTYTILGLSVASVGLMTFLPESITNWTDEDRDFSNLINKWWDNVSDGPVWDKDDHYLNYIMHPYFGGTYYTVARHSGFNEFESFLYSFAMSTFFWEYGVEAFAEVPSAQDIIVTPLFGAVLGEWMYLGEKQIIANGGKVLNSETLGNVSLFFLNPIGHIHHWITDIWRDETSVNLSYDPWMGNTQAAKFAKEADINTNEQFIGMQVKLAF